MGSLLTSFPLVQFTLTQSFANLRVSGGIYCLLRYYYSPTYANFCTYTAFPFLFPSALLTYYMSNGECILPIHLCGFLNGVVTSKH